MVYLDERNNLKIEDIELVAKEIKNGKIAIFPTETVYGIGTKRYMILKTDLKIKHLLCLYLI